VQRSDDRTFSRPKDALDFSVIGDQLDGVLAAIGNMIHRGWPARYSNVGGAQEFFLATVKVADNTYRTIRFICADIPRDPARKADYALSVPALNRVILDSLFTVVFILEDLPSRCQWYLKSGWRALAEELQQYRRSYANLPEWQPWLSELENLVKTGIGIYNITPEEQSDPTRIPRWPNPGKMPHYKVSGRKPLPDSRQFLAYLNDWFYRELSSQAHLSFEGLLKSAAPLFRETFLRAQQERLEEVQLPRFKQIQVGRTLMLVLALLSEIEVCLNFGLRAKLSYLWTVLGSYSPETKEVYDKRYQRPLNVG